MTNPPDFIFIDDDILILKIHQLIFQKVLLTAAFHTFSDPKEGLAYINSAYGSANANRAVLFLDINMPEINGWEIIEALHDFPSEVRQRIGIFILTSSIDIRDKIRAEGDPMVLAFISKPLSMSALQSALTQYYGIALD